MKIMNLLAPSAELNDLDWLLRQTWIRCLSPSKATDKINARQYTLPVKKSINKRGRVSI